MSAVKEKLPYDEFVDFLVNELTPQKIVAFQASPAAQERVRGLMEQHNAGKLTPEELEEVDIILEFERLFMVIKARALKTLKNEQRS